MKKNNIFTIIVAILASTGCSIEDMTAPESLNDSSGLWVENEIVHFVDVESFTRTMKDLHKQGASVLPAFEESIGLSSSFRKTLISTEMSDRTSLPVNIRDIYFASVVNSDGFYYIGDVLYKVGKDFEYSLMRGDVETLTSAIDSGSTGIASGIKKHRIEAKELAGLFSDEQPAAAFLGRAEIYVPIGKDEGGADKRAVLAGWAQNYSNYASQGTDVITQSYRRTCGICSKKWRDSAVPAMSAYVESLAYSPSYGYVFGNNAGYLNSYHFLQVVAQTIYYSGPYTADYINAQYSIETNTLGTVYLTASWR